MSLRGVLRISTRAVVAGLMVGGCFDSDQKIVVAPAAESSTGAPPVTSSSTGAPMESTSTGMAPPMTCRDTLACTAGCVFAMTGGMANQIDVIFTCLLECEPPTIPEAVDVFRLIECVTADCIEQGRCDILLPEEGTSSGGSSSSDGSSSSSSSSDGSSSSDSGTTGGSTGGSSSGTTGTGTTGSSSSSTGASSSGGSSSTTGDGVDPQAECINCLLGGLSPADQLPMDYACFEEAVACE
ncbi:MAG: hypothetical protein AAF721_19700 [Myxococcota bacterium]